MKTRILAPLLAALALPACLSQSTPPRVRWFVPDVPLFEQRAPANPQPLRILPVAASSHLRAGMVWRLSDVELFIEEQENWGASPTELVTSALESALFETGSFFTATELAAPTLSLDIKAFEGSYGSPDTARLEVFAVHDTGEVVRQRMFSASSPLESRDAEELARGMGLALHKLCEELREWAGTSS